MNNKKREKKYKESIDQTYFISEPDLIGEAFYPLCCLCKKRIKKEREIVTLFGEDGCDYLHQKCLPRYKDMLSEIALEEEAIENQMEFLRNKSKKI